MQITWMGMNNTIKDGPKMALNLYLNYIFLF